MDLEPAIEAAQRWAIFDPDPVTRGQIDALVDANDPALDALFTGRVSFGTAGLRAAVGPGPNRMNAVVVQQTTTAVVRWLIDRGVSTPRLLIGFDARHDSAAFAAAAAAAARAAGAEVLLGDTAMPTPVCAHAVVAEACDAGIVITASHNPATDNGYKLYVDGGLQLVPPQDAEIEAIVEQVALQWGSHAMRIDPAAGDRVDASIWADRHRTSVVAARLTSEVIDLPVAYSPMHGVGGLVTVAAFAAAGLAQPLIVEDQFEPDPTFPTVAFPNPEEPGALDLAIETAVAEGAVAALAQDPDADRLAVALPNRDGHFVALSGNELGVLLADHVLTHTEGAARLVARSVVSSRQLDAMAEAHGIASVVTLTGFKWLARPMLTHPSHRYVFGFEEAIGYCIGSHVRDKDGITAAVVAVEMLATLSGRGMNVWDRLDELAAEFGVHHNQPVTRWLEDVSQADAVIESLHAVPPVVLGGSPVERSGPLGLGTLPLAPGIHLETQDRTRVIVRPSGTEPKLKTYVEVVEPVAGSRASEVGAARGRAERRAKQVLADLEERLRP